MRGRVRSGSTCGRSAPSAGSSQMTAPLLSSAGFPLPITAALPLTVTPSLVCAGIGVPASAPRTSTSIAIRRRGGVISEPDPGAEAEMARAPREVIETARPELAVFQREQKVRARLVDRVHESAGVPADRGGIEDRDRHRLQDAGARRIVEPERRVELQARRR